MKKSTLLVTGISSLLALMSLLGLKSGKNLATFAEEPAERQVVQTAFFVRGADRGARPGDTSIGDYDVILSVPGFDATTGNMSITVQSDVELYQSLNFFGYIEINGYVNAGWGKASENGLTHSSYIPINAVDCKNNVIIRFSYSRVDYPSGYSASSITLKKGFQLPSYALKTNGTGTKYVYEAGCDFVGAPAAADYGWATTGLTDVKGISIVQEFDQDYNSYVGFDLLADDYAGVEAATAVTNKYGCNFTSSLKDADDNNTFKDYALFNLNKDGIVAIQNNCPTGPSNLTSITVPAGTTFPSYAANCLSDINKKSPRVVFKTQTDKTFDYIDGEYVCASDLVIYKVDERKALVDSVDKSLYRTAEQNQIDTIIAAMDLELLAANTFGKVDAVISKAAAAIAALPTDEDWKQIDAFRAAGIKEVTEYKEDELYYAEQADNVVTIKSNAVDAIGEAVSKNVIDGIVEGAKIAIDAEDNAFTVAKTAVDDYKKDVEYRTAEATSFASIKAQAKTDIDTKTTIDDIDGVVAQCKKDIDALKTAEEYEAEELAAAKVSAKGELDGYKASSQSSYRAAQWQAILDLKTEGKTAIDDAETIDDVSDILADYKGLIDAVKTDAEMTAEELKETKESGKTAINDYITGLKIAENYSEEDQVRIGQLVTKARADIDACTKKENVTPIVEALKAEIAKIETLGQKEAAARQKMMIIVICATAGGVVAIGAGVAVALIIKKKKSVK